MSIYRAARPGVLIGAKRLATGLHASDGLSVKAAKLRRGKNYFILVANSHGVTFQRLAIAGDVKRG